MSNARNPCSTVAAWMLKLSPPRLVTVVGTRCACSCANAWDGECVTFAPICVERCGTIKNMSAFDGLREKLDAIDQKLLGADADKKDEQVMIDRAQIREIFGNKLMREITLK